MHHSIHRIIHTMVFHTPFVRHCVEWKKFTDRSTDEVQSYDKKISVKCSSELNSTSKKDEDPVYLFITVMEGHPWSSGSTLG